MSDAQLSELLDDLTGSIYDWQENKIFSAHPANNPQELETRRAEIRAEIRTVFKHHNVEDV